ncbi:MAG TPA: carboxypeptidase-like regulatory domain-containing protein [Bryobacteraceae bacterium]
MRSFTILLLALASSAVRAQSPVVVAGQVTDAVTGLPIEDATVSIANQLRYTDSGGGYTLDPVAPGKAAVGVEAKGYLSFQGDIEIAADQATHNFKLLQSATISGRITAPDSEWRRAGFVVNLLREDFTDGVRRFVLPTDRRQAERRSVSRIDDDGYFEFSGLEPGRYIINSGPQRGVHMVTARDKDGKPLPPKHEGQGYVQTFFPGTPDFAAAIPVTVASGENRTADFTLVTRPLFRASGEAAGSAAPGDTIQAESTGNGRIYIGAVSDGKFVIDGLPPGEYRITTMMILQKAETVGNSFRVPISLMRMDTPFNITDHDVAGLVVSPVPLNPPIATAGEFRFASGSTTPSGLSVQFSSAAPGGESTPIPASPDGLFWLSDRPGEYSVRPVVTPAFSVTEIRYAGGNYLFSLIPLGSAAGDASITIVLSDQPASVSGVLSDEAGKPVAARIALLPDPIPAHFDFRAIRVGSTNDRGGFLIGGLAPGRYKAIALTGDDRRQDHDMTLIGPRLALANAFELTAGQSLTINLQP